MRLTEEKITTTVDGSNIVEKDTLVQKKREYNKEYYENNKEKRLQQMKEYNKEYYENNKEKLAQKKKEYKKEYREKNKEKNAQYKKEYQKEYREKNKEKIAQYKKEYREKNQEKLLQKNKNTEKIATKISFLDKLNNWLFPRKTFDSYISVEKVKTMKRADLISALVGCKSKVKREDLLKRIMRHCNAKDGESIIKQYEKKFELPKHLVLKRYSNNNKQLIDSYSNLFLGE